MSNLNDDKKKSLKMKEKHISMKRKSNQQAITHFIEKNEKKMKKNDVKR